ncbi:MAG: methyltransferase [Fusobacteria bacterium]|nr:methyltransferase [Fusobacteriota bacterium]
MEKPWSLYRILKNNRYIIQGNMHFRISADSFLLADFFRVNRKCKNILEIGTGTAIIPILLSSATTAKISTVEIQPFMAEIATKNLNLNRLSEQVQLICADISTYDILLERESFTHIVVNPPFYENQNNITQEKENALIQISKTENALTLKMLTKVSKYALKSAGTLSLIHRSEYLEKIIISLCLEGFHLSRLQFVYTTKKSEAKMVLIEAVKDIPVKSLL